MLGVPGCRRRVQALHRRRGQREPAAGDAGDDRHHPVPVPVRRHGDENAGAGQLVQEMTSVSVPEQAGQLRVKRIEVRRVPHQPVDLGRQLREHVVQQTGLQ